MEIFEVIFTAITVAAFAIFVGWLLYKEFKRCDELRVRQVKLLDYQLRAYEEKENNKNGN